MFRSRDGWRVEWSDHGKRHTKKFRSKREAEEFQAKRRLGLEDDTASERSAPTFEVFAERWLENYSKAEKRPTSHAEDRRMVERHLIPAFKGRRIGTLKRADLVELKAALLTTTAKGKTTALVPKSVNNVLMVAKKIMGYAVELDLVAENRWAKVKPCKVPKQDFDYWTPAEREEFYARAKVHNLELAQLAYFACHTGLRKGELAALTWNAVDMERRKVRVSASFNVDLGIVTPTKGGEVADVSLNEAALEVIRARRLVSKDLTVFRRGLFNNLRRNFGRLCRRVGVREIRFHDTRHGFASCLAMAGVDLLVIQQLLRHKSYQMTLRYAHLHPSHLAGATDALMENPHTSHTATDSETWKPANQLKRLAHPERLERPTPRFEVG